MNREKIIRKTGAEGSEQAGMVLDICSGNDHNSI